MDFHTDGKVEVKFRPAIKAYLKITSESSFYNKFRVEITGVISIFQLSVLGT